MMTIPFKELMRHEVTNDDDYYKLMQLYDERDDLYNEIIQYAESVNIGDKEVDELNLIQGEIDDIEKRIVNIRKKYNGLVKKFSE